MHESSGRPTGRFAYDVSADAWQWDEEVFLIHGYAPGSVEPTTQLFVDSKHPEDRDRVEALLKQVRETGEAFSVSYRLISADGTERRVVLVGEGVVDGSRVRAIEGYYIDLTPDFEAEGEETAQAAVEASAEYRAVIEQAKGMLMLAYGLDADASFAMLRWWSRNRNIKVREIAERLVEVAAETEVAGTDVRVAFDALMHDITT